jgi:hypothetical protein
MQTRMPYANAYDIHEPPGLRAFDVIKCLSRAFQLLQALFQIFPLGVQLAVFDLQIFHQFFQRQRLPLELIGAVLVKHLPF